MKYERVEIEAIEFGDMDFMTSSSQCDFVFYGTDGSYSFDSTQGNCDGVSFFGNNGFSCDRFIFWAGGVYHESSGTGYCSVF